MEALDIVSKYTNIRAQQFQYAGTKDKRAKTSQRVSVHRVTAEKLHAANKKLWGMKLGNFEYKNVSCMYITFMYKLTCMILLTLLKPCVRLFGYDILRLDDFKPG